MHKMYNRSSSVYIRSNRWSPKQSIYRQVVKFSCCSLSTCCQAPLRNPRGDFMASMAN